MNFKLKNKNFIYSEESAEDFYDYTSTISITEDEWFDNIEAEHPETREYTYNQMKHLA